MFPLSILWLVLQATPMHYRSKEGVASLASHTHYRSKKGVASLVSHIHHRSKKGVASLTSHTLCRSKKGRVTLQPLNGSQGRRLRTFCLSWRCSLIPMLSTHESLGTRLLMKSQKAGVCLVAVSSNRNPGFATAGLFGFVLML